MSPVNLLIYSFFYYRILGSGPQARLGSPVIWPTTRAIGIHDIDTVSDFQGI